MDAASLPRAPEAGAIGREQTRDRLLRRVDWRFLTGTPEGGSSVCFTDGALAEAVVAVWRLVDPVEAVATGDCDLAVAVNPDAGTLRKAWAALRPGGTCYCEWRGLRAGGPAGIHRRLARSGWADIACYLPHPDPAHARAGVWVPLDSTAATRFFLRRGGRPAPAWSRVGRVIRRALWLRSRRARFGRPICAVARKPDDSGPAVGEPRAAAPCPPRRPDFTAELLASVRDGWESWGLGPAPPSPALLLQTGGPRSVSKVIALVFAEHRREPALVVKMPRVPESLGPLCREAEALRALDGRAGVPRLLFARWHAGVYTVGESVVSGTPLVALARGSRFAQLARMAASWIGGLAEGGDGAAPREWHGPLVESALADFVATFGSVLDAGMVRETEARLGELGPLPLVHEHRDFAPWNVLLTARGELGVLDWESAEPRGLPALDLIYFLVYWGFVRNGATDVAQRRASYRAALNPSTFIGRTSRDCLDRYAARLRISARALGGLRLLTWLIHARSEYRRFVEDAGGTPDAATLRHSLFVALWEEEIRRGGAR